jgi:hypothetical protein
MTTIRAYQNGNCSVTLLDDGTKIRRWDGDPRPEYPESIDLKITNWCDAGCQWCHESSTKQGKHAKLGDVVEVLLGMEYGTEVAIGGGDPLSHPEIKGILATAAGLGLVPNVTVNGKHLSRHARLIGHLRAKRLIYGLGVSWTPNLSLHGWDDGNTVVHMIAGLHSVDTALRLCRHYKLLILGYKRHGRGLEQYNSDVERSLKQWTYWAGTLMRRGRLVAFDNLAIEQLRVQEQVTPEAWERLYMGNDGQFTMYVDAVAREFAVSSTSERMAIGRRTIREMFAEVRSMK